MLMDVMARKNHKSILGRVMVEITIAVMRMVMETVMSVKVGRIVTVKSQ